ncbi:MAG: ArnT family glycosyltransferase, partial [Flavobacteriales bacterium]
RFGFSFNGLYGQDAYAYLLHAREWKAFFLGGDIPGGFFWPPNYSILAALLSLLVKSEFYSLQFISVLSMVGLGGMLNRLIKEAYPQTGDTMRIVFVILAFLLSPFMFRLGMQSMSDMLAMFFLTASFYQLWRYFQNGSVHSLLLWSGFSALAITTRYPAVIVLLPAIICRSSTFTSGSIGKVCGWYCGWSYSNFPCHLVENYIGRNGNGSRN